jgi:hypothetical protein
MFPTGEFFVTSTLVEITSSETLVSEKAPWRSPSPGCRARFFGQLLMLSPYLVRRAENLNKIPRVTDNQPGIVKRC